MKNYTNLSVMKSSQVENLNLFKEETISSKEEFNQKVQKGILYKAFEPPANATMLKFRYYNDENTLIEQNNVPVVYDGTSIKEIVNYYFLTNQSSGIIFSKSTWQADGWTKESQNVSRNKRYLWCVSETIYTNTKDGESTNLTEPIIVSVFGEQGERGAIYLGHYASSANAYSENENDISSGDYFLNTVDSFIYVYDKDANTWTKISDYSDYRYNQSINDIFENITDSTAKENFIKAKTIWVQNLAAAVARTKVLISNDITLTSGTDLSGKTTSGKIHSANFVSGSSGWQIDYAGNAEFNNATIRGEIKGGTINIGDNFSVDENGNVTASEASLTDTVIKGGLLCDYGLVLPNQKIKGSTSGNLSDLHNSLSDIKIATSSFGWFEGTSRESKSIQVRGFLSVTINNASYNFDIFTIKKTQTFSSVLRTKTLYFYAKLNFTPVLLEITYKEENINVTIEFNSTNLFTNETDTIDSYIGTLLSATSAGNITKFSYFLLW